MAEVLVIDDDLIFNELLEQQISGLGHDCDGVTTLYKGISKAREGAYDIIFLDVTLPDGNGLAEIQSFKNSPSNPEIIIITGYGNPEGAEVAIKNGAWDYIQKPATINDIKLTISRVLRYRLSKQQSEHGREVDRHGIIGNSPRMKDCLELIAKASSSNINVLITGDTGTGKEMVAKAIHLNSKRAGHPFVVADCTSIPETLAESLLFGHQKGSFTGASANNMGLFLQANDGTLFLDEIGDLSLTIQKSFLRVLQERRFRPLGSKEEKESRFRLISATNRNLEKMITKGVFRKDLYYRLRTMNIHLPALRERKEDIPLLLDYYVPKVCREMDIKPVKYSGELLDACLAYEWPGNVREFVNMVNIACSNACDEDEILMHHLPVDIRAHLARQKMKRTIPGPSAAQSIAEVQDAEIFAGAADSGSYPSYKECRQKVVESMERKYLRELMRHADSDFKKACKVSDLSRARLYELFKKHSISVRHV